MEAAREEGIATICTSNRYQNPSNVNYSHRCIWSTLNIDSKKEKRAVRTTSEDSKEEVAIGIGEIDRVIETEGIEEIAGQDLNREVEEGMTGEGSQDLSLETRLWKGSL